MTKIFVFDTNVLVSAHLLPNSISRKAFDKANEIGILVYSGNTLTEFAETLLRPKFDKYISLNSRLKSISFYEQRSQSIAVTVKVDICRDIKDNKFLELALESQAECIVTGDKDLLVLNPFEDIPILTVPDFVKQFENY